MISMRPVPSIDVRKGAVGFLLMFMQSLQRGRRHSGGLSRQSSDRMSLRQMIDAHGVR
jgi:hypothetical protein